MLKVQLGCPPLSVAKGTGSRMRTTPSPDPRVCRAPPIVKLSTVEGTRSLSQDVREGSNLGLLSQARLLPARRNKTLWGLPQVGVPASAHGSQPQRRKGVTP